MMGLVLEFEFLILIALSPHFIVLAFCRQLSSWFELEGYYTSI